MDSVAVIQPPVYDVPPLCSSIQPPLSQTQPPLSQTRPSLSHTRPPLLQTWPCYNCSRFKYVEKPAMLSGFPTFYLNPAESYSLQARSIFPGGEGGGVHPHISNALTNQLRATGYRLRHSSCSRSFAITLKSSSVVTSPLISPCVAISRSSRRMILPDRVFGSWSVNRISSGRASAPISFATHARSSSFVSSSACTRPPASQTPQSPAPSARPDAPPPPPPPPSDAPPAPTRPPSFPAGARSR